MAYKNTAICFWSGTGNSYRVSTWVKEYVEKYGISSHLIPIAGNTTMKGIPLESDSLLGVIFPTHGFTAPWYILKSIWQLPRGNSTNAFCVATRAGLKFGPLFIPGISGSATFIVTLILLLKGYNVRGTMSVDMPSNWFTLHPIQGRKSHVAIISRGQYNVGSFMKNILSGTKVWFTGNNLYEITFGILLSIISVGYLFIGRFFLAKLFFANNKCDGCGSCVKHCSVKAIKLRGRGSQTPFWKYTCESCMKCAAICPNNAIEAGHSWGVILYFVTAFPFSVYLFSWFGVDPADVGKLADGHGLDDLVDIMCFYPAVFISYFVFSILMRIPLINWVFTHTTMTHLPFWGRYREPDTKLNDLT